MAGLKLGGGELGLMAVNRIAIASAAAINASWRIVHGRLTEVAVIAEAER